MIPKISVIVPNYNGSSTLSECIQSLLLLNYPKERMEIIIVDNGSTDNSIQIIKAFPVKLLVENNIKSSYAARNLGVKEATGEIFAFTDADCVVDKQWIFNAMKYLAIKEVGGVAGEVMGTTPKTLVEEFTIVNKIFDQSRSFNYRYYPFAITANAFYKKFVFDKIGTFETNWISGGDVDFSWRMQIYGGMKLVFANDCIVYHHHRTHPKGLYLQNKRYAYGACLLNAKYDNKFQSINDNKLILYLKLFTRFIEKVIYYFAFLLLFKNKKIYCLYLKRVSSLGYFMGIIQYLNEKH